MLLPSSGNMESSGRPSFMPISTASPLGTQSMSWRRDYIASSSIRKMIYVHGMPPGARTFTWRMPAMPSSSLQRWTAMCTSSEMSYGMEHPYLTIRRNGGDNSDDNQRGDRRGAGKKKNGGYFHNTSARHPPKPPLARFV